LTGGFARFGPDFILNLEKGPTMRVEVDEDLCICAMQCETICPEVFKVEGSVSVVQADPVPPEVEDRCREAVEACPANAINVIEE